MAKIKFLPVENPIDKLYSSATGMPFPVSAAAGQSSEPDPGPKPEPEPEPSDAVAEVSYDDGENRYWCYVDIPLPEGIESELDISDITVHLGFNAESTLDGPCEEGTLEFAYSNGEGGMVQIQDGNLHISITIDTGESDCMTSLLCNEYNSEDAPYPYGLLEMWANEDIETGESDAFNYRLSWTFTGEIPCNVGE